MSEKFILDFDTGSFRKEEKKTKPSKVDSEIFELMKQMNELENKHKQEMKVLDDRINEVRTKTLQPET